MPFYGRRRHIWICPDPNPRAMNMWNCCRYSPVDVASQKLPDGSWRAGLMPDGSYYHSQLAIVASVGNWLERDPELRLSIHYRERPDERAWYEYEVLLGLRPSPPDPQEQPGPRRILLLPDGVD